MLRYVTALLLMLIPVVVFAQETEKRPTITRCGPADDQINKLISMGFKIGAIGDYIVKKDTPDEKFLMMYNINTNILMIMTMREIEDKAIVCINAQVQNFNVPKR